MSQSLTLVPTGKSARRSSSCFQNDGRSNDDDRGWPQREFIFLDCTGASPRLKLAFFLYDSHAFELAQRGKHAGEPADHNSVGDVDQERTDDRHQDECLRRIAVSFADRL